MARGARLDLYWLAEAVMRFSIDPTYLAVLFLVLLLIFVPYALRHLATRGWRESKPDGEDNAPPFDRQRPRRDEQARKIGASMWIKYLAAILMGNALYFYIYPVLPAGAQHQPYKLDLGTVVDLWFCLCMLGLIELGAFFHSRRQRKGQE
jgi:hypothetical protein